MFTVLIFLLICDIMVWIILKIKESKTKRNEEN